jgi:hypothetical protein
VGKEDEKEEKKKENERNYVLQDIFRCFLLGMV